MTDFLFYTIKVGAVFSVLYIVYHIVFSRMTLHTANRIFLLAMMPLSLIVPQLNIAIFSTAAIPEPALLVMFDDAVYAGTDILEKDAIITSTLSIATVLGIIYVVGMLFQLIRALLNMVRLVRIKGRSDTVYDGEFTIVKANVPLSFSCFNWIFVAPNEFGRDVNTIIEHEKLHAKAKHTFDLVLTELFIAAFWFNPFVYLFRRDLKAIHEFQIDSKLLQGDVKTSDYLQLMLKSLVAGQRLVGLYNYFNGLTVKKRVNMITKNKNSKLQLLRYLVIVPIIMLMTMSFTESTNSKHDVPSILPIQEGDYDRISSTYGMRMHPIKKENKFHSGIDFAAKEGTDIVATADGVVSSVAFKENSYGKIVVVNHGGGYETWYTQMSDYAVKEGDKVTRGEVIGYVGSSGLSTGSHLHYEVRKDGQPVDPEDYFSK